MARPFKDIDEDELLKRFMKGVSSRELAKQFGISRQTVLNRLNKYVDIEVKIQVNKILKS